MKKHLFLCLLPLMAWTFSLSAVPVKLTAKVISETIEIAAKRSGRVLSPAGKAAAGKALEKAFARYGDDVLKAMQKGGLESLKQGARHGGEFWKICARTTPQGARSLALHGDILMPLVRKHGIQFMELESKVPGLGAKAVDTFGDDAVRMFAKAPADDVTRMIGYAAKADNPKTVRLLQDAYVKSNGKILDHLNWKHIMAAGLSTAAIISAYKLTNSMETLAESNPELLANMLTSSIHWLLVLLVAAVIILFFSKRLRRAIMDLVIYPFRLLFRVFRKNPAKEKNPPDSKKP